MPESWRLEAGIWAMKEHVAFSVSVYAIAGKTPRTYHKVLWRVSKKHSPPNMIRLPELTELVKSHVVSSVPEI